MLRGTVPSKGVMEMPSRFALSLAILGLLATSGMAQANHFPPEVEFLNGTQPHGVESCAKQNALSAPGTRVITGQP
ncbi:MAG: hypothetical protein AAB591_01350 [Patescibacteria group bacterium]